MASHSNCHLAVFDKATGSALELFRARRVASPAQRIMLIARDGGCTKPGCTIGAYGSQAHHVVTDWIKGGNTNVDELGLACGADNRSVTDGGWTTTMNDRHEVEWIPPSPLDTGQARINNYHVPERLLRHEDPEPRADNTVDEPAEPTDDGEEAEQIQSDNPAEPGGPAPPDNHAA